MSNEKAKLVVKACNLKNLNDKSDRQNERILSQIREHVNKTKKQPVTYYDVADYYGIPPDKMKELLF